MIFSNTPRPESLRSIADVKLQPFWMDNPDRPIPLPPLSETSSANLTVIGGGFTGLWTALLAKQQDPNRTVILLEGGEIGSGASGRNGGFMASSLTHSFQNGINRWPREIKKLIRLGHQNLDEIERTIREFKIQCDYNRSGEINVANEEYQVEELRDEAQHAPQYGEQVQFLDREEMRARVNSPTYLAGILDKSVAIVNPAQFAWGLKRACLELGVHIFENSPAIKLTDKGSHVIVETQQGKVNSQKVALATNAFPPLLRRLSHFIVPVYDYVLMTEPLSPSQRASIGWHGREGLSDYGNQFHYYRTTADGRILWGGYDAIYYPNNEINPRLENRPETFGKLAEHFFQNFPQLAGLSFTHAWGGVIDTSSRYTAFWGRSHKGKIAYSLGYTGLGVGASRFGANVMLDLLDGKSTERTELEMVKTRPFPFPPEPLRSPIVNFTRWSLNRADQNQGRRNLYLKMLDALGLGFDS